ncbi:flippase [Methylobacillus flagellatus]|uniref:flippase n=1 Tax=Methylobacillus flagellatus TaxID=405 RepID=UPI0028541AE2|nr:flippase [Methylobacillus flagellatus]MDR5171217.1 flippase [Methylobacillus flagellatus]
MNQLWIKYLPRFIQSRLDGRVNLQAALGNSGWLIADKVLRMGVGLIVGVWIARYLGPEQFGLWNYVIAFTALFSAFATLGLDSIVVRDIVKYPDRTNKLLGTAFILKIFSGLIALIITLIAIYFVRGGEPNVMWLVGITAVGFIFQSINVIDFYFQAKVKSKYTVISATISFTIITIFKVIFLLTSAPLEAFVLAALAEIVMTSLFMIAAYYFNGNHIKVWVFDKKIAVGLLKDSWPLILSSFAIMIYMRIDQIMIGDILDNEAVGLFSAAVRISELWYFVPMAIVNSVLPSIIDMKSKNELVYDKKVIKLFNVLVIIAIIIAVLMSFFSDVIVSVLFGKHYYSASSVLIIHIWTGIFVVLGVASSSWLTIEDMQKYSFYRTLNGCVVNVALNLLLIPKYGINGAAFSTVISYGVSVFSVGFFKRGRKLFFMMVMSMNPFLYAKNN